MVLTGKNRGHRPWLTAVIVIAAVLSIVGLWKLIATLRPLPPKTVVMVTGPEGSAFHEFGKRYRELLSREGVDLRLVQTAGALENLTRLTEPRTNVEVGFLPGGVTNEKKSPELESLGTVGYEPLWFFYRGAFPGSALTGLRGRKISIGPEGSGTRVVALKLLELNGIDRSFAQLLPFTPQESGEKLLNKEIDAAFMLTSWDSPVVRQLVAAPGIELASFPRADAYIALYPFLNRLTLPEGVGDIARNRPPREVTLFAPKASLVVRKDLHPAIQYLLLDAADQVHSGPGIFQKPGQFPALESVDLPLSDEARQFHKSGRPFLQRHLPFWLAVMISRLLILVIPVVGILYPLLRLIPALYGYDVRRRILKLHRELWTVDEELRSRPAGQSTADLAAKLDSLDAKANSFHLPLMFSNLLYTWRIHITLVRDRLKARTEQAGKMPGA